MPLVAPDVGAGPFITQSRVAALRKQVHHLERRPRLVVVQRTRTVYVTAPLPQPQTAFAASTGEPWQALAECESGGDWTIDHGHGGTGGIQIAQSSWESEGGLSFSPVPYEASPAEQIAVGERILADQGVGAWPTCGPRVGL